MPKCNKCGETDPNKMATWNSHKSGYRTICKACANAGKKAARARLKEESKRPVPRNPQAAGPRDYVPQGNYVPDPLAYYRNNGNKHIQSRGM
jgi:hypothetical protein